MGKLVVSVRFCLKIRSICERKIPRIDPEIVKNFEDFVVFNAISVVSERFRPKFQHNQLNNERMSYAFHFLKRSLQRFASKTLQNDSKAVEKFHYLRFGATCVLFESFWSQNDDQRSTRTEFII